MGIVKNCREFLTEYTLPCICSGTCSRMMASRLALISGMAIQPRTPPMHHTSGVLPSARKKFSELMENSRQLQMTRTRLLGAFTKEAKMLPASVAMPITAFTRPSALSLPPSLESIMAGKAAW